MDSNGITRKNIIGKVVLTVLIVVVFGILNSILNPVSTLFTGKVAGQQFDSNDVSYVTSDIGMKLFSHMAIPGFLLFLAIVLIWWKPAKTYLKNKFMLPAILLLLLVGSMTLAPGGQVRAYYDQRDRAEVFFILPNESAFYIPDTGANKDSQATFGSEQYLRENKVAAKRFQIPHVLLKNSAFIVDYYVPAGRLVIVDRTPYNREWTAGKERGTSAGNQSFPCQSTEGINMTFEVSIAASVHEEDSPKFLYWFGVNPPKGDRTDKAVTFTSVYYSRSLSQVMDTVARGKVQAILSDEVGSRSFAQVNASLPQIKVSLEAQMRQFLSQRGITLDYIGWAGTITFDPEIQRAVNDAFIAKTLSPYAGTLQTFADIKVKEGLAKGLGDKGLPSFLPPGFVDWITGLIKGKQ